jgi:radical SAM superfamily enzyme YgiQ (UPF0313 family)
MRVALVKLYDDYCHGPRCLQADLLAQGHEAYLINLKPFHMGRRGFGAFDEGLLREIRETDAWVEVQYDGEVFLPEHIAIAERETEIFLNLLAEIKPEMICFSVTSDDAEVSAHYTRLVREHFPGVPTVWGGVEISHEAPKYAKFADRMIRGEGETPLRMLAEDPWREDIPSLHWVDRSGEHHETPMAPLIQDCDSLAWPTYGVNEFLIHDRMLHRITVETHREYLAQRYIHMTGRGCPFKCTFCHHWKTHELYKGDKYLRRRSPSAVVDQLQWAQSTLGVQSVMFWDDVFLMNTKWVEAFASEYQSRMRMPIGGLSFPTMTTERMIDALVDSPFVCVGFGIQSGSEFVVQGLYNRGYFNDKIKKIAWYCHEKGIEVTYDFLIHNPYESEDDIRASLRLILDMPVPYNIITKRLYLYPNSPINALPYPRHSVDEKTWQHCAMLMHLARDPSVPREVIWDMANNEYLKARPEIVTAFVKSCLSRHNASREDPAVTRMTELNARKPMPHAEGALGRRARGFLSRLVPVGRRRAEAGDSKMPAEDGLMAH